MSTSFRANGIITLMTDFGLVDPFVGVMKGAILRRYRDARIVDLTHGISPYSPREAGFWLSRSFGYFPAGTVHVCVVDPGVGTSRNILAVEIHEHVFLAPDNGLLTPVIGEAESRVVRVEHAILQKLDLPPASATFHGRDIFAPIAAELAAARCQVEDLGPLTADWVVDLHATPERTKAGIEGLIVTVDRFGNLISNIDAHWFEDMQQPVVHAAGRVFPVRRTYGDASPGEYLALVNAFGVLELAQTQGNAHAGLGLARGTPVRVCES